MFVALIVGMMAMFAGNQAQAAPLHSPTPPPPSERFTGIDDGYACIVGKGKGVSFSWALVNNASQTIINFDDNAITPNGNAPDIAKKLANEMPSGFYSDSYGCIGLNEHTLYVGESGETNTAQMCQVKPAVACSFNPTIQLVTKEQMFTSIKGFLWNDLNENRLLNSDEGYHQGWTVVLTYPNNSEISKLTDANGRYEFPGLSEGKYVVTVETRAGVTYTTPQSVRRTVYDINDPRARIPRISSFGIKGASLFELTVSKTSNGTISTNGINCGSDCSESYVANTQVTLTASPDDGYNFVNWTDACTGTNPTTTVTVDGNKNCTANFVEVPKFNLTVNQTGNGNGAVDGAGSFAAGTTVNLIATPADNGSAFGGWAPAPCASSFEMPAGDLTCTATFTSSSTIAGTVNVADATVKINGTETQTGSTGSFSVNVVARLCVGFSD
jgi:uncharacterized repeat protein (TIGR02543 family)